MYIWWHLTIFGSGFFVESLPNPVAMPEVTNLSASKAWQVLTTKNSKILTKRPPVATTVPSGIQGHHWGISIPGYTIGSSIQAWAIPSHSWVSALLVTTGSIYSLQWPSSPSTLQKRRLYSLFMIAFWERGQKMRVIWRKLTFSKQWK